MMAPDPSMQATQTQGAAPGPAMGQPSGIGALVPMSHPRAGKHGKAHAKKGRGGHRRGRASSKKGR